MSPNPCDQPFGESPDPLNMLGIGWYEMIYIPFAVADSVMVGPHYREYEIGKEKYSFVR